MTDAPIPLADLKAGYLAAKPEIDAAIQRVLDSGWYILGQEVKAFEAEFAAFCGLAQAVGVANGTDALVVALRALGIGPGDRVATVSHTAVATVAAIEMVGATPVLVDIDSHFTMDPEDLAAAMAEAPVKAVIPVHLYGMPAAMPAILDICARAGAAVLEDCSQAHGASLGGVQVGSFGPIAAFSLYPTKNLGAIGDGGVIATGDAALAARCRAIREYGWKERYVSDETGVNSRLDELQAAILRVKLRRLAADNARRREIAAIYDQGLAGTRFATPAVRPGAVPVYHLYVIRVADRPAVQAALKAQGIATNIHYPLAVHRQKAYAGRLALGPSQLRRTEEVAPEILSLPMFPELTDAQAHRVVAALRALA